jgi:hypothetical protein
MSLTTPPHQRGYNVVYRTGEVNHCPGCGRTHWYIGRVMAECAFCTTALPLELAPGMGSSLIWRRGSYTPVAA